MPKTRANQNRKLDAANVASVAQQASASSASVDYIQFGPGSHHIVGEAEACRVLGGISRSTLFRMLKDGRLRRTRIKGVKKLLISRLSLLQALEEIGAEKVAEGEQQ